LRIILAYNTPRDLPVEQTLRTIAQRDPRFLPLRVEGSTSKAQNVNAALAHVDGDFVGIFDADHHPAPYGFTRAWRWLASGYDVVQGHCVVRNGVESWVARMVAVEFETIYAVSHPGRARLHQFGIFGGSNGFWKTDLLRRIRMRASMLTEDIDASLRTVKGGYRIASDRGLLSRELAPATLGPLTNQRFRWAQGWFQVSLRYLWRGLRSQHLSLRQKLGLVQLLGWRELYPYLSVQVFPIILYWVWKYGSLGRINWLVPIFVLTTVYTVSTGPVQVVFTYLLAAPEVRRQRRWFVSYTLLYAFFFTQLKNVISVVAHVRELMRERQWKVTPRGAETDTHEQVAS
jgi:cellulose synthase/poly-beta-1,6-N-acetylglucosamine synthase-like glycosyltransferase